MKSTLYITDVFFYQKGQKSIGFTRICWASFTVSKWVCTAVTIEFVNAIQSQQEDGMLRAAAKSQSHVMNIDFQINPLNWIYSEQRVPTYDQLAYPTLTSW